MLLGAITYDDTKEASTVPSLTHTFATHVRGSVHGQTAIGSETGRHISELPHELWAMQNRASAMIVSKIVRERKALP
jgi:hypothetical protein